MREGNISTGNITQVNTGFIGLASGTTAQRPASPTAGMIRFNSQLAAFELYRNSAWLVLDDVMNNLSATLAPTTTNDSASGYAIGSIWQVGAAQWICTDATASAAKWAVIGAPRAMPGILTNIYHTTNYEGPLTTFAVTGGNMYAVPFRGDPYQTVNRFGFRVTTATFIFGGGVTGAIYSNDNGVPANLLLNCGTASSLSTGDKEITISYTMPNEWIWLVLLVESGFSVQSMDTTAGGPNLFGRTATTTGAIRQYTRDKTYANGLPPTFGTGVASVSDAPIIWLRKV